MLSSHRQPRWNSALRRRLFGEGLLDRARSASIGLFAVSTAVGLALVFVALNQTWHVLPNLPIPASPFERGVELDADDAASASAPARDPVGVEPARRARSSPAGEPGAEQRDRGGPGSTSAQQVSAPVSVAAPRGGPRPAPEPDRGEPGGAASPPPAPAAEAAQVAAAPNPPASGGGTKGSSSKGRALGHSKGGNGQGGGPPHSGTGAKAVEPSPSYESAQQGKSSGPPSMDPGQGSDSDSSKEEARHD